MVEQNFWEMLRAKHDSLTKSGTIVADDLVLLDTYKATIDACFGEGSCHVLNIRNYGAVPVTVDM